MSKDGCTSSSTETRCKFADPNIGVEKFLDLASLDNHDEFCLSYVFSHREFSDGVLGLAWIGDSECFFKLFFITEGLIGY